MAIFKIEGDCLLSCTLEESDNYCVKTPKGVKIIKRDAFKDCRELESLTLGEDVEVIETNGLRIPEGLTTLTVERPLRVFDSHSPVHSGLRVIETTMKIVLPLETLRATYSSEPVESVKDFLSESLENLFDFAEDCGGIFVVEGVFLTIAQVKCYLLMNRLLGTLGEEPLRVEELLSFSLLDEFFYSMMVEGLTESLEESPEEFEATARLYIEKLIRNSDDSDLVVITEENCEDYGFDRKQQCFTKGLPPRVRIDVPIIDNGLINTKGLRELEFSEKVKITDFSFLRKSSTLEKLVLPPSKSLILPSFLPRLKTLVLPSTVRMVSGGCNLTGLRELVLPEFLTTIDDFSFTNCYSLETLTLPKSLETIGKYSFTNEISLKSVRVLGNRTRINSECFRNCKTLREVSIKMGMTLCSGHLLQSKFLEKVQYDSIVLDREGMRFFNSQAHNSTTSNFLDELEDFIGPDQIAVAQGSKGVEEQEQTLF